MKLIDKLKLYIKTSIDTIIIDQIENIILALFTSFLANTTIDFFLNEKEMSFALRLIIIVSMAIVSYIIMFFLQIRPHRFKFHIVLIDIFFEYKGNEIFVNKKYKIKTNRFKVNRMYAKTTWYSDEKIDFIAKTKGYSIKKLQTTGDVHEYYIIFPKALYFWQQAEFEIITIGKNTKHKFKNFYCYDVIAPTNQINIRVKMDKKYCTKKAVLKSFFLYENNDMNKKQEIEFNGEYVWNITTPSVFGDSYMFEWQWSQKELNHISKSNKIKKKKKKKTEKGYK